MSVGGCHAGILRLLSALVLVAPARFKASRARSVRLLCRERGMCVWKQQFAQTRGRLEERYLYTLRHSLTGTLLATPDTEGRFNSTKRLYGWDWPELGMTMVGVTRMELLHETLHAAYNQKRLEGDFLEAGVWRGGACIYARGFMEAYEVRRKVWVVDSFRGLPPPEDPRDKAWEAFKYSPKSQFLAVSRPQVEDHFRRYQLLDSSVEFVEGFFSETLPTLSGLLGKLAILRLDGDLYKSTLLSLCYLYPRLQVGGFWIIDDWHLEARDATWDFITANQIVERPVHSKDQVSVWFEKHDDVSIDWKWCLRELSNR